MIHYHGTPLTPRSQLIKMAGKHFCVSFARPDDLSWCLQNGQSVMLDNGAFTTHNSGKEFDHTKFYNYLEPILGHPHWAVIPDVIDGTEEDQRELLRTWPFSIHLGAPVWHLGLPIDYLLYLADSFPRICFGSSGRYWEVGSEIWCRRADEAFNALSARHRHLPWVHMLRGLSLAGDYWPFASADSVNVSRNFKCAKSCPERMARRIDAIQCPTRWEKRAQQLDWCA